jgi:hypothetical protein
MVLALVLSLWESLLSYGPITLYGPWPQSKWTLTGQSIMRRLPQTARVIYFWQVGRVVERLFIEAAFHQSGFSLNGFFIKLEAFHRMQNFI